MREKSKKVLEVERFVDSYIKKNGVPPTYDLIAKKFGIAKTAAFSRCAKIRDKMKAHSAVKQNATTVRLKVDIPNDKLEEVSELIAKIYNVLKAQPKA